MNAAELYTLAAPVLDRIGWPEGVYWSDFEAEFYDHRRFDEFGHGVQASHAAAVIRCHIEDWLLEEPGDRVLIENNHHFGMMVGYYDPQYRGESALHALIAAATAELEKEP